MLIVYGSACLAVVILSLLDRRSLPYSITLAGGWLLGFLPLEVWWFISLGQGAVLACYLKHDSPIWPRIVAGCIPLMLMADAVYWLARYNNHDVGPFYENALNVLLGVQLAFTAWPGGRRLVGMVVALSRWIRSGLGGFGGVGAAARGQATARRDGASRGFRA